MHKNADNDGNGTIIIEPSGNTETMSVRGMRFDVSEATGPVTVMVEIEALGTNLAFLTGPDVKNVIDTIQLGVKAKAKMATVRTRGTDAQTKMATLTITEGFKGAFELLTELEFEVSGLPGGVELEIAAEPKDDDDDAMTPTSRRATVAPGMLTGDEDGDDKSSTITLGRMMLGTMRTTPSLQIRS